MSDKSPDELQKERLLEEGRLLFARPWNFVLGVAKAIQLPESRALEIAFAGRSNVGKSSLINALVGQKALARTSNTPGRTQELNFFANEVEDAQQGLTIVDMPGYGFAKAPKESVQAWTRLIHTYLKGRPNLRRAYVLIDSRHGVKETDLSVIGLLDNSAVSYQIIMTKADKPKKADLAKAIEVTKAAIAKRPAAHPDILLTSSETGEGIAEVRAEIALLLTQ